MRHSRKTKNNCKPVMFLSPGLTPWHYTKRVTQQKALNVFCIFIIGVHLFLLGCKKDHPEVIKPVAEFGEREPAFSPDGKFIAYTYIPDSPDSIELGGIGLFEIATEESEYLTYGSLPDWSPDGNWVVYVWARDIYKINVETEEIKQLTTWGSCFFPDWSPNGNRIAFDISGGDSGGIWLMDTNGTNYKRIKRYAREPDWSPSGNRLVHIRYVGVTFPEIFIMDSSGNNSIILTNNQVDDHRPAWSPDGSKIAYVSGTSTANIFLINTDGTNEVQLTFEPETDNGWRSEDPTWAPDGSQIVYVRTGWFEDEQIIELIGHLWIMDADGKNKRQLTGL